MKSCTSVIGAVVSVLAMNMFIAGCGGGDDNTVLTATGTWGFADPAGVQDAMTLAESGGTISGTSTRGATISGTRSGANANIDLHYPKSYTIKIVVVINGDRMSGTVTDSKGGSGTFEAIRDVSGGDTDGTGDIAPGTYVGTMHETVSASGMSSVSMDIPVQFVVDASGQIMQADVSGSGSGMTYTSSHTQNGNQFSFTMTVNVAGFGAMTITWTGVVNGNVMTGTISGSGPAGISIGGSFQATRQ